MMEVILTLYYLNVNQTRIAMVLIAPTVGTVMKNVKAKLLNPVPLL